MISLEINKENRGMNGIESWKYEIKTPPIDIEFTNLTYTVSTGRESEKMILKGISGQFKSNELTAILGPSGSGKSSLLNILTGYRNDGVGGMVTINGQPRNMRTFRKMSCYVMQDDLFQPNLTVLEAMHFAADLKLGFHTSRSAKQATIIDILKTLRLMHAQHTISERLSGGEGKRLSIALELVNNPPVIILDEPTTGLDELSSIQCIDLLQKVALGGRTVICSIHTPSASIFSKFHHVYIVAAGQCVYRGPSNSLVPFLSYIGIDCPKHYNPADFVIDVSYGEYGLDFVDKMVSTVNTKYPINITQRTLTYDIEKSYQKHTEIPWHIQFYVLYKRIMLQTIRDKNYIFFKLVLHALAGLLIGTMYLNMGVDGSKTISIFEFCFASLLWLFYVPMIPVILYFPNQLLLVEREHFNGWYSTSPYFFALNLSTIPAQIMMSMLYIIFAYSLSGQPLEIHRVLMFCSTCLISAFIGESLGFALGTIQSVVNGLFVGSVLHIFMNAIALQGFGDKSPLPLHRLFFMYISYVRYSLEALVTSIFGYNRESLSCPNDYCHFKIPNEILKISQMENCTFWVDFGALIFYFIIIRVLSYYLLQRRLRLNYQNIKVNKR